MHHLNESTKIAATHVLGNISKCETQKTKQNKHAMIMFLSICINRLMKWVR